MGRGAGGAEEVVGKRRTARAHINDHLLSTHSHGAHVHDRDHMSWVNCARTRFSRISNLNWA